MDGFDKLINNRTSLKTILIFICVLAVSAVCTWFGSAYIADIAAEYMIQSSLSAVGGGKFTAPPDSSAILQGEELLAEYSITADMSPRLMECWGSIRVCCFCVAMILPTAVSIVWLVLSLRNLSEIYDDLEKLRSQCIKFADDYSYEMSHIGGQFDCVGRLSQSLTLISQRLSHLNSSLKDEKDFLSDFLTDFSHQLKTSLAVVRLNSDMLSEMDNLSEEKKEMLSEEIQTNLDGMEDLVINAIKLAKINADSVEYSFTDTDLSATCRKAARRIAPLLREKNISAEMSCDDSIAFPHDSIWLCEAFENIIKNSADHSGCTHIKISTEANPALTKVIIEDNGKGIPQREIPYIFRRFGKKSRNIRMTSAGVGMSISRKIINAHNGEAVIFSEEGCGARFEISFLNQ